MHSNYSEAIQIAGSCGGILAIWPKASRCSTGHWPCALFFRVLRFWMRRANFSRLPCVFVGPASKGAPTPIASLLRRPRWWPLRSSAPRAWKGKGCDGVREGVSAPGEGRTRGGGAATEMVNCDRAGIYVAMVGLRPPVGTWVYSENCPLLPYRLRTPHHTPLYEQTTGLPPYLNLRLLISN